MNDTEVRRRPGGRSARVRQAVLTATLEALVERGPNELNVADVAKRAGVHETSIYRRWGTREKLMMDAMLSYSDEQLPVPNTGSLRGDLIELTTELAEYLSGRLGSGLMRAMAASSDDPATSELRTQFLQTRFELASPIIHRAIDRGELPESTDAWLLFEVLLSPLYTRVLISRQPLDPQLPGRLADVVISAFGSAGAP